MEIIQSFILALLATIFCLSTIGNTLLLLFTVKIYKRELLINVYITSICISDLCSCIFGLIPEFVVVYNTNFINSNNIMCVSSGLVAYTFCILSIHLISVLSFVQMISIRYPFFYRLRLSHLSNNLAIMTVVTLYSFMWGVSPYWYGFSFVPDIDRRRCSLDWRYKDIQSYLWTTSSVILIIPTVIQIFSLLISKKQLLQSRRKSKSRSNHRHAKFYIKAATTFLVFFLLSWTPYTIVIFLVAFNIYPPPIAFTVAALFAKLSTLCNPVVYFALSKRFKKFIKNGLVINNVNNVSNNSINSTKPTNVSRHTSLTSATMAVIANAHCLPVITENNKQTITI